MRMNRRNVLVGIGALTAGGGAVFGSGAFSSVEADRTVNVSVQGDSSAFLELDPSASGYAQESGGTLQIDLDSSASASGSGLNTNATTSIDPLFTAANRGDTSIDLYVDTDDGNSTVNGGTAIENTVTDGSTTLGTIQFIFKDSGGNVIVSTDGTDSVNLAVDGTEDITLDIVVPDIDPASIDTSTLLSSITIVAEDDGV